MRVLHIQSDQDVAQLREWLAQHKPVFLLVYMEGCGPCNATRPEWAKLGSALQQSMAKTDVLIADVNKDLLDKLAFAQLGSIDGFPTLKYIDARGDVRAYEDSRVRTKNRSVDSFVQWVEGELGHAVSSTSDMKGGGCMSCVGGGSLSSAYDVYARLLTCRRRSGRRAGRRTNKRRRRRRSGRRRRKSGSRRRR